MSITAGFEATQRARRDMKVSEAPLGAFFGTPLNFFGSLGLFSARPSAVFDFVFGAEAHRSASRLNRATIEMVCACCNGYARRRTRAQHKMSASTCPIDVPADPAALSGPPILRPEGLPEWGLPQLKALKHTHRWQFAPSNYSADGWKEAIYASQFRADCSRLLLVEDDLTKAGLGFTAKIWNVALLLAMRDNRVLVEVRIIKVGNTTRSDGFERPRWCDRPPYTLQCLYQPWTHCPLPGPNATEIRPGGRPLKVAKWPHDAPYVRTGLGRIHRQGTFWYGARSSATREAGRFLFRPRPWVTAIADCAMSGAGLAPQGFINLHIRHSVEKEKEGQKLGVHLPLLPAYDVMIGALADDLGTRSVWLQTSSSMALERFVGVAREKQLKLFFTNNSRSENDAWGGWKAGVEMEQATVGAVNAHMSSLSVASVSADLSLWTNFLSWNFTCRGRRGEAAAAAMLARRYRSGGWRWAIDSAAVTFGGRVA